LLYYFSKSLIGHFHSSPNSYNPALPSFARPPFVSALCNQCWRTLIKPPQPTAESRSKKLSLSGLVDFLSGFVTLLKAEKHFIDRFVMRLLSDLAALWPGCVHFGGGVKHCHISINRSDRLCAIVYGDLLADIAPRGATGKEAPRRHEEHEADQLMFIGKLTHLRLPLNDELNR